VTAALVELDTLAAEVVVATIGSGDIELGVVVMLDIVATVMGAVETVLLLCIAPSVYTAVDVDVEVSVTTTFVPVTVTVDADGESVVVIVSVEYHSGMNVTFVNLIGLNLPLEAAV
jgi:hypothetical protein